MPPDSRQPPDVLPGAEALPSFAPVGYPFPLRRGVAHGGWVAVSGQFGQRDFRLVSTELAPQVRQALDNVSGILCAHGAAMSDVVKTSIFLADLDHFDEMDRVYLTYFDHNSLPARTTAGVMLPFGALIEIEAWACVR